MGGGGVFYKFKILVNEFSKEKNIKKQKLNKPSKVYSSS